EQIREIAGHLLDAGRCRIESLRSLQVAARDARFMSDYGQDGHRNRRQQRQNDQGSSQCGSPFVAGRSPERVRGKRSFFVIHGFSSSGFKIFQNQVHPLSNIKAPAGIADCEQSSPWLWKQSAYRSLNLLPYLPRAPSRWLSWSRLPARLVAPAMTRVISLAAARI